MSSVGDDVVAVLEARREHAVVFGQGAMWCERDGKRLDHAGWPYAVRGLFVTVIPPRPFRRHVASLEIGFDPFPPAPCRVAMAATARQPEDARRRPGGRSRSASSTAQSPPRSPRSPRTSRPLRLRAPAGESACAPAEPDKTSGSPFLTCPPYGVESRTGAPTLGSGGNVRRFRFGHQSGSHSHVCSSRSSNRTGGFPASGSRTRSCLRPWKASRSRSKVSEVVLVP